MSVEETIGVAADRCAAEVGSILAESASVREFLYRRSVFAYAFRLGRLDEEFAVLAA